MLPFTNILKLSAILLLAPIILHCLSSPQHRTAIRHWFSHSSSSASRRPSISLTYFSPASWFYTLQDSTEQCCQINLKKKSDALSYLPGQNPPMDLPYLPQRAQTFQLGLQEPPQNWGHQPHLLTFFWLTEPTTWPSSLVLQAFSCWCLQSHLPRKLSSPFRHISVCQCFTDLKCPLKIPKSSAGFLFTITFLPLPKGIRSYFLRIFVAPLYNQNHLLI